MHVQTLLAATHVLFAFFCAPRIAQNTDAPPAQAEGIHALAGEWIFVEDRTVGRPVEEQQPSMNGRIRIRIEENAFVLMRSDGDLRIALDGSPTEIVRKSGTSRYRGAWKDGAFAYEAELSSASDGSRTGMIQWELRATDEGLIAHAAVDPPGGMRSVALYRHPQDIALSAPAKASAGDLAWLSGTWIGTRGASTIEERWCPPLGGALLGTSRTVRGDKMTAFEFLRIVERDGGLVYAAQPNGAPPTEFVLIELSETRAVFENPRHDFPQRIVYELSAQGGLNASIGYCKGGRPRVFEYAPHGE